MMQLQQIEKIKESQKNRAYHAEKIKNAQDKNDIELLKKREVCKINEFIIIYLLFHKFNFCLCFIRILKADNK